MFASMKPYLNNVCGYYSQQISNHEKKEKIFEYLFVEKNNIFKIRLIDYFF